MSVGTSSEGRSRRTPVLIGVAGGTASGKSSVCDEIMKRLGSEHQRQVAIINQDSFYRNLTPQEALQAKKGEFNFDHPDAFEEGLLLQTLKDLKSGQSVTIPKYDYVTNSRMKDDGIEISPVDVVLVEGILVFYFPTIRELFGMKLFVDADPDTRLSRRVLRDTSDRGRSLEHVLHQYLNLVKPAYEDFCLPTKKYADVIIPRGAANEVAIDLIVQHIMGLLKSPRNTPVSSAKNGAVRSDLEKIRKTQCMRHVAAWSEIHKGTIELSSL